MNRYKAHFINDVPCVIKNALRIYVTFTEDNNPGGGGI
jgi:hypothetical protein